MWDWNVAASIFHARLCTEFSIPTCGQRLSFRRSPTRWLTAFTRQWGYISWPKSSLPFVRNLCFGNSLAKSWRTHCLWLRTSFGRHNVQRSPWFTSEKTDRLANAAPHLAIDIYQAFAKAIDELPSNTGPRDISIRETACLLVVGYLQENPSLSTALAPVQVKHAGKRP